MLRSAPGNIYDLITCKRSRRYEIHQIRALLENNDFSTRKYAVKVVPLKVRLPPYRAKFDVSVIPFDERSSMKIFLLSIDGSRLTA